MSDPVVCSEEMKNQLKSALDKLISHQQARESNHNKMVKEFHDSQKALKEIAEAYAKKTMADALSQAKKIIADAESQAKKIIADAESQAKTSISQADAKVLQKNKEVSQWKEEQQRIAHTHKFEPRIKIDVGGSRYTTSTTTLCRFPESMIGVMFSGRHALTLDDEGYYFIDRDGAHFRHILNFLRDPENFTVELSDAHLGELRREATYYGIVNDKFSFKPSEPVKIPSRDSNGYEVKIKFSQDADSGLWFMSPSGAVIHAHKYHCNNYWLTKNTVATCCRSCNAAYAYSPSNAFIGVKNFIDSKRTLHNSKQPSPTANKRCPFCSNY